ncbi:nuclear mRNA export, poly(A)+RNA binding protein [Mortierella sp. AD031]|nr:nuclear mRNA export, poly(A)+RNA binding protein [Mortierella sp. AD031]
MFRGGRAHRGNGRRGGRGGHGGGGGGGGGSGGGGGGAFHGNGDGNGNDNQNNYNNNNNNSGGGQWQGGGNGGNSNNGSNGGRGRGRGGGGRGGGGRGFGGGGGGFVPNLGPFRTTNMRHGNNDNRGGSHRGGYNGQQGGHNGGRGGGGNGSGNLQGNGQAQYRGGTVIVFVTVHNQGQGSQGVINDPGLCDFLCRKALPTTISPTNPRYNQTNDTASFVVGDLDQAKALRDLSGIRFNYQKLKITTSADASLLGQGGDRNNRTRHNQATIEAVRQFIQSRHNSGFLNLERLSSDPILQQARITLPGQNPGRHDSGSLIFEVAAELFPEVTTISLAYNGLASLQPISSLSQYYPQLLALSLKGNNISSLDELQYISGGGQLLYLTELVLQDNPVQEADIRANNNDANYRSTVTSLFPSLTKLDSHDVARVSFGLVNAANLAPTRVAHAAPVRGGFIDTLDTRTIVLEFLMGYFKLFDTDRKYAGHLYDCRATFSCSVIPIESSMQQQQQAQEQQQRGGHGQQNQQNNTPARRQVWLEYLPRSRNLLTTKDLSKRVSSLYVGNDAITQTLLRFPETRHDMSNESKFCVDAWQTGGLLRDVCIYASVHGEYEEFRRGQFANPVRKSFDRTFVLAPAPIDTVAAMNGWKCMIISDHLTVREHRGHEAWKPEPALNVPSTLVQAINGVASGTAFNHPDGLLQEQDAMAQELMLASGLVYQYAVQALVTSGWNIEQAFATVQATRDTLPPNAWQLST